MLAYWIMFLMPALGAVIGLGRNERGTRRDIVFMVIVVLVLALMVGLRDETGGDWGNYADILYRMRLETFDYAISSGDPGFVLVSRLCLALGVDQYGVNFVCGAILLYGLLRLVRTMPDPWLALTAAIPYLVIVVGMGYIRQAAAIGGIMLAFVYVAENARIRLALSLILAISFHITAICVVPVLAATFLRKRPALLIPLAIIGLAFFVLVLQPRMDVFYNGYIVNQYDSSGALVRLLMNAVPSVIFLIWMRKTVTPEATRFIWTLFALISLALVPIVMLASSTTVIDRIGLYFSPIQVLVFGWLTTYFGSDARDRRLVALLAVVYYAVVLYVWLNYADNASAWVPYEWIGTE